MKKRISKTKRIFTTALSLAIVLGFAFEPVSVYADENEPEVQATEINDPITVNSGVDLVYENPTNVNVVDKDKAIYVLADSSQFNEPPETKDASIKLNGNVSLSTSIEDNYQSGSSVYLESIDGKSNAEISGNVNTKGYYYCKGVEVKKSNQCDQASFVDIGGNVSSEGKYLTYGFYLDRSNTQIKVGKDIITKGQGYLYGIRGSENNDNVLVNGKIFAEAEESIKFGKGVTTGLDLYANKKSIYNIKQGIISKGGYACGATIYTYANTETGSRGEIQLNIEEGGIIAESTNTSGDSYGDVAIGIDAINENGFISLDINGNVVAKSKNDGTTGIIIRMDDDFIESLPSTSNINIHGNLISDVEGIHIDTVGRNAENNILVEGSIEAKQPIKLEISQELGEELASKPYEELDPTLNLTAWKIQLSNAGNIAEYVNGSNSEPAPLFEKMINYIIKSDQPTEGGTFALKDAAGNDLATVNDLEVAHEGEKIYVEPSVEDGYVLKGIYNGTDDDKLELSQDEEGRYYILVPKGGGVYLTMEVERNSDPTPTGAPSPVPTGVIEPTPVVTIIPVVTPTPTSEVTPTPTTEPTATPSTGEITDTLKVYSGDNLIYENPTNVNVVDEAYAIDVRADSSKISEQVETNDASLKLNGNVSISNSNENNTSTQNCINIYGKDGNPKAEITGNIESKNASTSRGLLVNGTGNNNVESFVNIGGSVSAVSKISSYALTLFNINSDIKIGKDIYSKSGSDAYGIDGMCMKNNTDIVVEGNVIAEVYKNDSSGLSLNPSGAYGISMGTDGCSNMDIRNGIISKGFKATGASLGANVFSGNSSCEINLNVGEGGILAESVETREGVMEYQATGLSLTNYGGNITSDIKGNVVATSPIGSAVGIVDKKTSSSGKALSGTNNIHIHGDLISDGEGIYLDTVGEPVDTNVVVEGTIDSKKGIILKRSSSLDSELAQKPVDELDPTLSLTAWKIKLRVDGNVAQYYDGFSPESATKFEKTINYIIKSEQPSEGGTFAVSDIDGNALATVKDLEVAHEGDIIYVEPSVEDGYVLKGVYSGIDDDKIELTQDEEGKYYLVVPKGGGVYLTMDVEKKVEPTPTPEVTPTPEATPTPEVTPTPEATPTPEVTPTPAVTSTPAEIVTPTAAPSSQPTSGTDATPTPGTTPGGDVTPAPGGDVTPAPGGDVTPAPGTDATPTPSETPDDGSTAKKDNKTTFKIGKKTLKNKSKIKKSAKIKIKDKDKIKSITLNGKKIKIKKNKTSFTLKLKSHKKKLKAKGKWNKLVVTDKNGKKKTLKFKIKK